MRVYICTNLCEYPPRRRRDGNR